MKERVIFHVDVNSAFLSWEAVKRIEAGEEDLRNIPSCIGGDPKKRTSIVTAKSIPAKKYGIKTGEPVSMAIRKCPELVVVQGDFKTYDRYSKAFKKICKEYTPLMQSFSIDEVFLDMTGMSKLYPDLLETAAEIKDRIKQELGFTVNIGIGENKLCAKMASDFEKPDRVHTLYIEEIQEKMWPLPVGELFTCGKASVEKLNHIGVKTIGDLAKEDINTLKGLLGEKLAIHLYNYANGIDDDPVVQEREDAKGFSSETTVEENLEDIDSIKKLLMAQADVVASRLRKENAKCQCIAISFRTYDWKNKSHQKKLSKSTNITEEIYNVATILMKEAWNGEPLRLIGLSLTDIDRSNYEQIDLFNNEKKEKLIKLDSAIDQIRSKYGIESIQRASTVDTSKRIGRRYKAEAENVRIENNRIK